MPQVGVSTPASALTEALAGLARVTMRPGCVTWTIVPEPPRDALSDPDTGQPGVRIEFRTEDGALAGAEHRTATMFTWWDRLPEGIGGGGQGIIVLRARYLAAYDGPHVIGAGGVGRLTLTVDGIEVAAGRTDTPADPVEAMVRPGEIRATVYLTAGREAEIAVCLRPDDWPQGPVAIRLGLVPAPDDDTMLSEAVEAARAADAAVVVVGSGPATESEGFDRSGLALPGRQDELVRRVGREVVQAYLEPPDTDPGRPVRALAAFAAVTAAPGEYAEARLTVPARAFARYDDAGGTWVRPSGEFTVRVGRSSADLPLRLRVKST